MNLVFIGFRATGKTTVGRRVAATLGWDFVDTDEQVEAEGRTIAQIFSDDGEERFRKIEAAVVKKLSACDETVIAVGGGAVFDPVNATALLANGYLIWLRASAEAIEHRLEQDAMTPSRRPSLTGLDPSEEITRLLTEREEGYRKLCSEGIDTTDQTKAAVAQQVVRLVKSLPVMKRSVE